LYSVNIFLFLSFFFLILKINQKKYNSKIKGFYSDGELTPKAKIINQKLSGLIEEYKETLVLKGTEGEKTFILNNRDKSLPNRIALIGLGEKKTDLFERRESARTAAGNNKKIKQIN
jgi:hypothetical protein